MAWSAICGVGIANGQAYNDATTRYASFDNCTMGEATAAPPYQRVDDSYDCTNMSVRAITNTTTTVTSVFTLEVNSATVNNTVSFGAGVTGEVEDTTHTDSIVAHDTLHFKIVVPSNAGATAITATFINILMTHSGTKTFQGSVVHGGTNTINNRFVPCAVALSLDSTESNREMTVRQSAVYSNLTVYVPTSTRSGSTTDTLTVRKNGASVNGTVTITTGATGYFEDTTNTDSFTNGDELCFLIGKAGGLGNWSIASAVLECDVADKIFGITGAAAASNLRYVPLIGLTGLSSTENDQKLNVRYATSFQYLQMKVVANTRNAATHYGIRVNGSTAADIDVTASTTGVFEETSTRIDVVTTDDINWITDNDGGGSSGTISWEFAIAHQIPTPAAPTGFTPHLAGHFAGVGEALIGRGGLVV